MFEISMPNEDLDKHVFTESNTESPKLSGELTWDSKQDISEEPSVSEIRDEPQTEYANTFEDHKQQSSTTATAGDEAAQEISHDTSKCSTVSQHSEGSTGKYVSHMGWVQYLPNSSTMSPRFACLNRHHLFLFENEDSCGKEHIKEKIVLSPQTCKLSTNCGEETVQFRLSDRKEEEHLFVCNSEEEAIHWVKCINSNAAVERAGEGNPRKLEGSKSRKNELSTFESFASTTSDIMGTSELHKTNIVSNDVENKVQEIISSANDTSSHDESSSEGKSSVDVDIADFESTLQFKWFCPDGVSRVQGYSGAYAVLHGTMLYLYKNKEHRERMASPERTIDMHCYKCKTYEEGRYPEYFRLEHGDGSYYLLSVRTHKADQWRLKLSEANTKKNLELTSDSEDELRSEKEQSGYQTHSTDVPALEKRVSIVRIAATNDGTTEQTEGSTSTDSLDDKPVETDQSTSDIDSKSNVKDEEDILEWCNMKIKLYKDVYVTNFTTDWKDGVAFNALAHSLLPELVPLSKIATHITKEETTLAIKKARQRFELIENLSHDDIKMGYGQKIYKFVKEILQRQRKNFVDSEEELEETTSITEKQEEETHEDKVLRWCQDQINEYPTATVNDFGESWKDGLVISAILHSIRPELLDYDSIVREPPYDRLTNAIDLAEQIVGISSNVRVEDFLSGTQEVIFAVAEKFYLYSQTDSEQFDELHQENQAMVEVAPVPSVPETVCPEGMERCKNCSFTRPSPPEEVQVFKCLDCKAFFCRKCKIDWFDHQDQRLFTCEEAKNEERNRKDREDALSMAIIRQCHRCKILFAKDGGCNNMQCICGATQCYCCQMPNVEYNHFCSHQDESNNNKCVENCGRHCPLNSDENIINAEAFRRIRGY